MIKTLSRTLLVFSIFISFSSFSIAGIKYYQTTKIRNDGSASIYITYSAPTSEVSKNNNLIGVFPFLAKDVAANFFFKGIEFKKNLVYKDPNDANNTRVALEIDVKDVNAISNAKAFAGMKIQLYSTDSGLVFSWPVSAKYIESNSIETYQFIVNTEPEVKWTNGTIKDKDINWFLFGNKVDQRGYNFTVTLKSDLKITSAGKNNSPTTNKTDVKADTKKDEGCGLFGLEMPLVLLGGLVQTYRLNRKKQ